MHVKMMQILIATLCLGTVFTITLQAQGGWDVWTIYLRDGTRIDAAPVWSLDANVLKYGMSGKVGEGKQLKRSLIDSMSRSVAAHSSSSDLPDLPPGEVRKDLVVMSDGRQVTGPVLIRASKNASGELQYFSPVLVQNEVEIDLRKVEHIKLAKPKRAY